MIDDSGGGDGPKGGATLETVTMLHGFTQTGRCLGPVADGLRQSHEVLAPDLPGHGDTAGLAWMDCRSIADHLVDLCGPSHWIGYSLGGRIALQIAVAHPGSVHSLVLIGATAGIEDPTARRDRRSLDHERATEVERLGVDEFTRRWLGMDMFAGLPPSAHYLGERRTNTAEGLAGSLRNAGTGSMEPLWERLRELRMPVLLLSGEHDTAFTGIAERMEAHIGGNATAVTVPGAGHAAHLEAPGPVLELIEDHLRHCDRSEGLT
ncbi:MAG: alpha/beta fold hydrolase [Microthrixaceae bacterium]|nr:alpha/beta fold hydrolase [Microthrixaceae bacterium]